MKIYEHPTGSQSSSWWTRQRDTTKATAALLATLDAHLLQIAQSLQEGDN